LIHPQHLLTSGTASPHGWQAHPVAGVDHFQSGGWITFRAAGSGRADAIVNQIFTAIAETLVRGDGIEIRGFGSFTVRHYGAYEGRNPRTGAPSYVKAKRLPFFKVGKELRERIEAGRLTERAMHRGKLPPST